MELNFQTGEEQKVMNVTNDCYLDELFASLYAVDPRVSNEQLQELMRQSDDCLVCEDGGQCIPFKDYADSNPQLTALGISSGQVYRISTNNNVVNTHING